MIQSVLRVLLIVFLGMGVLVSITLFKSILLLILMCFLISFIYNESKIS